MSTLLDIIYLGEAHYYEVEYDVFKKEYEPDVLLYYQLLESGMLQGVVCKLAGEVQGYALFLVHNSINCKATQACSSAIYVRPEFRGMGYAKAMVDYFQEQSDADVVIAGFKGGRELSGYKLNESLYIKV